MPPRNEPVAAWLFACCALVALVLVTGGVTRLTHCGLSIVEWKPVTGILPPLGRSAWEAEFEKYRATPEWLQLNADMTLDGFKSIYRMEYAHRLLARLAGLAFVLPFLLLAATGNVPRGLLPRFVALAVLWALQGGLGWFMVASGLVDIPRVSPYRLTAHLLAACVLYGAMFWTALDVLRPVGKAPAPNLSRVALGLLLLGVITLASGGLVAGLKAGFLYNTFPTMMGYWVPPMLLEMKPAAINFFENELTVQFDHRVLALLFSVATIAVWRRARHAENGTRRAFHVLLGVLALQVALGIATLLLHVPVVLGAAHQANALALLSALLFINHDLRRRRQPPHRELLESCPP